jgi:F-type H+-transporting ATPase subunit a
VPYAGHLASMYLASGKITVGDHALTAKVFGMTVDLDVVWSTGFAAMVVLGVGFYLRSRVSAENPGKLQLFWEVVVDQVQELTDSAIGPQGRQFVPLAIAIFFFIWACNWIEAIPSGHSPEWFPAPTSDVNLPLAMALTVIALVHYNSIKARGFRGYLKHYTQPYAMLTPINIIEEITKPITLTFRLFGNLFSGSLMLAVIAGLLPLYVVPLGDAIWKPFDMFIGLIQAFIFALLTVMYLGMGMSVEHDSDHQSDPQRHRRAQPLTTLST